MSSGRPGWMSRRVALGAGLLLAVAATAALVLTDDLALLRLAVVGALWAFLIAAFLATGLRRAPGEASTEVVLRRTHELELEREVALRREAELNVEVRVRREIEAALREDIAGLRGDVARLRHDILERWDGELRVERVAVRAESTRVSGFGATFHALQDEARRLADQGRPLFEVEAAGEPTRVVLVEAVTAGAEAEAETPEAGPPEAGPPEAEPTVTDAAPADRPHDAVSTVEFGVVRPDDTPEQERTGPVLGLPIPPADGEPAPAGRRARSRHEAGDERAVDAGDLVRRLHAEATGEMPVITDETEPPRRRRRARDDDETNDVLARVLGDR